MRQPGSSRPTITDIARIVGVSAATVSNALNGRRHVDADTSARVCAAARLLGYVPNLRARRLRTGGAGAIALLSSMSFGVSGGASRLGFLMEIAAAAASAAMEHGLALMLVPPPQGALLQLDAIEADGALIVEPVADDPILAHFRRQGVPVVCIGRPPGHDDIAYVDLQSGLTAELMMAHLHDHGARRIALLVGTQRRNAYIETELTHAAFLRQRDLPVLQWRADESGGEAAGHAACHALLRRMPDLDGLCVPVDAFAVGALRALADAGRSVPRDVRLVTRYDGLRARTSQPALTAFDLHLDALAEAAVGIMLAFQAGHRAKQVIAGPTPHLIVRGSSRLA